MCIPTLKSKCIDFITNNLDNGLRCCSIANKKSEKASKNKIQQLPAEVGNLVGKKLLPQIETQTVAKINQIADDFIINELVIDEDNSHTLNKEQIKFIFNGPHIEKLEKIFLNKKISFNNLELNDKEYKKLKSLILLESQDLTKEQLSSLIHKLPETLEELTIQECTALDDDILQQISARCPNLLGLDVKGSSITTFSGCNFSKLIFLYADETKLTEEGLQELSKQSGNSIIILSCSETAITSLKNCHFKNLQKLHIDDTKIDDTAIQQLSEQNGNTLEILDVSGTQVTSFENTKFTKLKQLRAVDTKLKDASLHAISKSSGNSLIELCLQGTEITSLANLDCPNLQDLDLMNIKSLNANALDHLGNKCPELTRLDVSHTPIATCEDLGCKKLKVFDAFGTQLIDQEIAHLGRECAELEELILGNTNNITSLLGLNCQKLTKLDVSGSKITNQGLECIGKECPQLETLKIGGTSISTLQGIVLKNLKVLNADHSALNNEGIDSLANDCPEIENLNISFTTVDSFSGLPKLKKLKIRSTDIRPDSIEEICKKSPLIEVLDMSGIELFNGLDGVAAFKFDHLRELYVSGLIELTNKHLITISNNCGKKLEILNISNTSISSFKDCLFPALKKLNIEHTKITANEVMSLLQYVEKGIDTVTILASPKLRQELIEQFNLILPEPEADRDEGVDNEDENHEVNNNDNINALDDTDESSSSSDEVIANNNNVNDADNDETSNSASDD